MANALYILFGLALSYPHILFPLPWLYYNLELSPLNLCLHMISSSGEVEDNQAYGNVLSIEVIEVKHLNPYTES